MCNPESGNGGKECKDGMLVLRIVATAKYATVWSMVHVGGTTVESIPNDNYSIHLIFMIVAFCIRFSVNI